MPNANSGWHYTLDQLGLFFEHALAIPQDDPRARDLSAAGPCGRRTIRCRRSSRELLGNYLDSIRVLARRTAELHTALSSRPDIPDFAPEPFTTFYRQSVYHGMLGQLNRSFELLRGQYTLAARKRAGRHQRRAEPRRRNPRAVAGAARQAHVGNAHSQLTATITCRTCLFAGSDWVITNFEGDPTRPLSERRIKRSALRDVATMLRSFHYVSHAALFGDVPGIVPSREAHPQLEKWAHVWYHWVSAIFLKEYLAVPARKRRSCRSRPTSSRSCWAPT